MTLGGLWTIGIKKCVAALATQLGCVFSKNARALSRRLQDVQTTTVWLYSVTPVHLTTPEHGYSVITPDMTGPRRWPCLVQQGDETGRLHAVDAVQDIISDDTTNIHPGQGPISCIGPRGWYGPN
jgi:hypothetical protein